MALVDGAGDRLSLTTRRGYSPVMRLDEAYRVLDLSPGASEGEVTDAYRLLAKVWHPDRLGDDPSARAKAQERLTAINAARGALRAAGYPPAPTGAARSRPQPATPTASPPATPPTAGSARTHGRGTESSSSNTSAPQAERAQPRPATGQGGEGSREQARPKASTSPREAAAGPTRSTAPPNAGVGRSTRVRQPAGPDSASGAGERDSGVRDASYARGANASHRRTSSPTNAPLRGGPRPGLDPWGTLAFGGVSRRLLWSS
jgi:hypothetical protein